MEQEDFPEKLEIDLGLWYAGVRSELEYGKEEQLYVPDSKVSDSSIVHSFIYSTNTS